jgi:hypothetical protein
MTTFNGASGASGEPTGGVATAEQSEQPPTAMSFGPAAEEEGLSSALDLLRERVDEREQEPVELWMHEITKVGMRIYCDPQVADADYRRWVKASMPKVRRGARGRAPGAMDIDQLALSARAILATNERVEVRTRKGEWITVTDPSSGEVLTLDDSAMARSFNVMDPVSLLRKLFGRDADLINAGQDLLAAAGYLDSDDDEDPE